MTKDEELKALYAELDTINEMEKTDMLVNDLGDRPVWAHWSAWIERKVKIIERIVALQGKITLGDFGK